MSSINNALTSIINRNKHFCCLCLCSIEQEPIRLNDEVVVNINNYEYETTIAEVLNSIFNEEMFNYVSLFDTLCEQCIKSALSFYKFIHKSKKNAEYLTNVLEGITNSFEYTTDELFDSKSLYVSLNLEDFTSKHYYDSRSSVTTSKAALRRFRTLDNTKQIQLEEKMIENSKKENVFTVSKGTKKSRNIVNIPTRDMLFDNDNRDVLKCKECLKLYPTIWNLRNHFIRVHAPKVFKCTECPRRYGSAAFLDAHKTLSHSTNICSECGKTFTNRYTLKIHEMGHHLSLVCQDCGRVYKNKTTFKKHIELNVCGQETRAHPSEAKYTCAHCNKKYTQKVSLRVHIQYEHGNYKAHVCEWCGKKFWAQSRLKAHIVKHTREKKFSCNICGGKFVSKESLLYHTRTHTGEKPYKCPHCDCRYLSASRRSDHVKRHHLGATLECDICHSKFNSRSFLLKHKKTHMKPKDNSDDTKFILTIPNTADQSKNITKSLESECNVNDLWKMSKVEDDSMPSFQKIIDSSEVIIDQFPDHVYKDEEMSSDCKVYFEVTDPSGEYMKILGV